MNRIIYRLLFPLLFSSAQTRQPVFVQLLQAVFRVYHCNWLTPVQKGSVENCIKVLSDVGKIKILEHSHRLLKKPSLKNPYF